MKKIFFIYVFSIVFTNICISQSFLDDDLNYWDFPLNGLGNFDKRRKSYVRILRQVAFQVDFDFSEVPLPAHAKSSMKRFSRY